MSMDISRLAAVWNLHAPTTASCAKSCLHLYDAIMAFKKPTTRTAAPESPDRLFRDLPRRKHASLYDHQGQILRTYVSTATKASDVALQLPTGSGKTLVGLLLAE